MNTMCAMLALPPILTPFTSVYLMCIVVPLISTTLVNNVAAPEIMNRATGKKHSKFDTKVIPYVMCSYGFKFLPTIVTMVCLFKWASFQLLINLKMLIIFFSLLHMSIGFRSLNANVTST